MKTSTKIGGGSAAVIACCVVFTPIWEGMDLVAKPDAIGTGHPITYCNGQTDEFGKVKAGQRFTPAQCNKLLAKSLPKYLNQIQPCIKVALPVDTEGALLDAAYNAGGAAVCKSPMLAKMNAGDLVGGCNAFSGWYIRSDGKVRKGLINRRNSEKQLCLKGVNSKPVQLTFWQKVKLFFLSLFKGN
jgi:lysozyme